jgi:bacteriocin biosynthesis cyclodehydratase domain-containing protein
VDGRWDVSSGSGRLRRMRRILLPGTHLLRRGDGRLQAGLDPAQAVVLPPGRSLSALAADHDPDVARMLDSRGLLVDEALVRGAVPGAVPGRRAPARASPHGSRPGGPSWPRHAVAALVRTSGSATPGTLRARQDAAVSVVGFGGPFAAPLAAQARELAGRAALALDGPAGRGRPHRVGTVGMAVGVGEPARTLLDPWLQRGVPHLVVRLSEGRVLLGPFVDPGRTACLRCLDAHRTDQDPDWPLLVHQYAAQVDRGRADGVPEPVDPALTALAVAWAVRDVATFAEGHRPTTWSATLTLSGRLEELGTVPWLRHPECGCAWE